MYYSPYSCVLEVVAYVVSDAFIVVVVVDKKA